MGSRFPAKPARSRPPLAAGSGARPIPALLQAPGNRLPTMPTIENEAPPISVKAPRRPQFAALLTCPPARSADTLCPTREAPEIN